MESLREKMQSETSLLVVGSADDVLRVDKSRRRLENVSQSMVDVMIVVRFLNYDVLILVITVQYSILF